ncbi:MAG: cell division protein FtsA [Dehalococcoidia bacterium]
MYRNGSFAAIDVGSTKVCTLVGEHTPEGDMRVVGVGISPTAGINRGMVDNIQQATESIVNSVEKAERSSGTRIVSARVSISGSHITCMINRAVVAIPGRNRPIGPEDVARVLEAAEAVSIPSDREVLHVIPRYFVVDGQEHVSDPVGMHGQRLDVETLIVTGSVSAIQNLTKCVEGAGVQVEDLVLSSLASAEAVLEEEEKRQGVVLADIGGGTTGVCVFAEGTPFHTAVLPVGGYHLTHDLVAGIRAPFDAAEEAKTLYGHAIPSTIDSEELVEIDTFGADRRKSVSRRRLTEILQARVEEILEMIYMDVRRSGYDELLAAGLVLSGGSANLPGMDTLAEQVLRMPARIGVPHGLYGLSDILANPAYATGVGLLRWALREAQPDGHKRRPTERAHVSSWGWLRTVGRWFRFLLPQ